MWRMVKLYRKLHKLAPKFGLYIFRWFLGIFKVEHFWGFYTYYLETINESNLKLKEDENFTCCFMLCLVKFFWFTSLFIKVKTLSKRKYFCCFLVTIFYVLNFAKLWWIVLLFTIWFCYRLPLATILVKVYKFLEFYS